MQSLQRRILETQNKRHQCGSMRGRATARVHGAVGRSRQEHSDDSA
jgi:hypothetical protein